jgi:hypothetical protein
MGGKLMGNRNKEEHREPSKLGIFLTLIGMCFLMAVTVGLISNLGGLIIGLLSN